MKVIVPGLILAVAACSRGQAVEAQQPAPGPATLNVVRVVEQPLNVTLDLPGELDAFQAVAMYPRVTGFVKSIRVDRGSRVRSGELLAVIEAPELAAQRSEAASKVQAAEAQLAAVRSKADSDASTYDKLKAASATPGVVAGNDLVIAQKTVDSDRSQVTASEQNVEAAKQALKSVTDIEGYLRITAPFDGIVTERNVHPGALVGPGGTAGAVPIVRIVENRKLRLVVPVPESYVGGLTIGTSIPFSVSTYPGESFSGSVARIAQAVDQKTRTMAVEVDVPNVDGRLAPGEFCQVKWPLHRTKSSLLVPTASVASTTGRVFVVRVRDGRAEWVDVKTGVTAGTLVEVFGDLHAGDMVAARGTDEIRPGTQVTPKAAAR